MSDLFETWLSDYRHTLRDPNDRDAAYREYIKFLMSHVRGELWIQKHPVTSL